ncbi:unnamed protein product [marine sediment metagenome]|uniref:Helix-turn-helix domain-containing protein n=1 Tax=marine sediment metagenome TaxID=412755 RepID=X1IU04_9ZZZZ
MKLLEEYLTVKDVASKLGVKPVTTYKWIREGKLKGTYFKIGGVYRFDLKLLEKHLEDMITND